MFHKICIITLLVLNPVLSQASVTGLGNLNQASNFQEYLKNNPGSTSLQNALIENRIKKTEKYINSKYALAVKGLLLNDLTPSKYLFKELAEAKNTHLFSKGTKKLVSESYYRLSNLERTKSNFWIKEGVLFDLKYEPSTVIFNPDIIASFKTQQEEISNYSFELSIQKIADLNTNVFINGNLVSNKVKIHPSAIYHLNLFKDGYKSNFLQLSGQELIKSKRLRLQKLDLGTCKTPKFKTYQGIKITEIFFSKECIKQANSNIKLVSDRSKLIDTSKKTFAKEIITNPLEKSFFKKRSTWLIIAGTVATAVIIASLSKKKDVNIVPVQR